MDNKDGSENDRRIASARDGYPAIRADRPQTPEGLERSGPYDVTQMQDWKKRDTVLFLGNCSLLAASLVTLCYVLWIQGYTIINAHPRQFQAEAWQLALIIGPLFGHQFLSYVVKGFKR